MHIHYTHHAMTPNRILLSALLTLSFACSSSRADLPPTTVSTTVFGNQGTQGDVGNTGFFGSAGNDGSAGDLVFPNGGAGDNGEDGTNGGTGGDGGTGSPGYLVNGGTVNFVAGAHIFGGQGGNGGDGGQGGDGGNGGNGGAGAYNSPYGGNGGDGGTGGTGGDGGQGGNGGNGGVALQVLGGDVHIWGGTFLAGGGGSAGFGGSAGAGGSRGTGGTFGFGDEGDGLMGFNGGDGSPGNDGSPGTDGTPGLYAISIEGGHVTFHTDSYRLTDLGGGGYSLALIYGDASTASFDFYSTTSDLFSFESLTPVPEPATYAALFGAATLGLAVWRRRATRVSAKA